MILEQLVESGSLRMPGPVLRRRFGDKAADEVAGTDEVPRDAATGEDRLAEAGHEGDLSGRPFGAAHRDLTAMGRN